MLFLASRGAVTCTLDWLGCLLDSLEPCLLAGNTILLTCHAVAHGNVIVVNDAVAAAVALVAAAAVLALMAALACHKVVIIVLLMMAFVLTIVSLLVARVRAAFFPHVLARFMDFAVPLV